MTGGSADRSRHRGPSVIHAAPLLVGVLLALRAYEPIRDNSFLWHIRAGALQIATGRVVTVDPFSFTAGGETWRTQSWLVELVYGWLEGSTASLAWANWFVLVVGAAVLGLMGLAMYDRNRSPVIVTVGLLVTMWLFAPFAQARPVIVSYVFLALVVLILRYRDRMLWLLVPLFWIWAGVHGSWALGGALVVLELIRTRDVALLKAGVVSLGATALTAHGIGAWVILYEFSKAGDALGLISEWQPPNFGGLAQGPYLLLVGSLFVGFARGKLALRDLVVVLPFLFYGMTSERAVFPATIVIAPYAVAGIPAPTLSRSGTSRTVGAIAVALIAAFAVVPMVARPLGVLDAERFPNDEIVAAIEGRTPYHDTAVGGFLIYSAWPDVLVYIDDRAELYGYDRLDAFIRAQSGDYVAEFDRYGIDVAVVKPESALAGRLAADGWTVETASEEFLALVPGG